MLALIGERAPRFAPDTNATIRPPFAPVPVQHRHQAVLHSTCVCLQRVQYRIVHTRVAQADEMSTRGTTRARERAFFRPHFLKAAGMFNPTKGGTHWWIVGSHYFTRTFDCFEPCDLACP